MFMSFPRLTKEISKANLVIFFDFEGTQIRHKAIALGIVAFEKEPGKLVPSSKKVLSYKAFIRTTDEIGPVVKKMTGINETTLKKEGKPFSSVIKEVMNLTRKYKEKVYISYGDMDLKILYNSINKRDQNEYNFFNHILKNYLDFHLYLSHFLIDDKGQSLSIKKLLTYYKIKIDGKEHDPLFDSKALMAIYLNYIESEEKTVVYILKNYKKNPYLDDISKAFALKAIEKKNATLKDLKEEIKKNL